MRNVYVSFLGTGKYESTPYYLDSPAREELDLEIRSCIILS